MILFPYKFRLNSDDIFLAVGHIFIKDFLQRFLAFRLPQKIPFPKTVICYLLFVTQKIHLWKLSTVNCNAWDWWHEHVSVSLSVSFSPHVICNHVTFCKHVCKICYLLFVICTAKNSFSETVILLYCNAWGWCHWPVMWHYKNKAQKIWNISLLFVYLQRK